MQYPFQCPVSVDEVVALKKLKMEKEKEGFPITSLREVCCLLKASHPNIVHVRVRKSLNVQCPTALLPVTTCFSAWC